jgi:hypothetical protein
VCHDSGCERWVYGTGQLTVDDSQVPLGGEVAVELRTHGDLLVVRTADGLWLEGSVEGQILMQPVSAADAVTDDEELFVATVMGGDLVLLHSEIDGNAQTVDLGVEGVVSDVALALTDEGLMIAAIVDDTVQWGFYGR